MNRRFKVGNVLRGYVVVTADTLTDAWEQGRAKFNKHFPTDHEDGRMVYLDYAEPRPPIYKGPSGKPFMYKLTDDGGER